MINDVVIILAVISFGSLIVWAMVMGRRLNLLSNKVYGLAKNIDKMIKTNKKIIEHIKYLEGKKDG